MKSHQQMKIMKKQDVDIFGERRKVGSFSGNNTAGCRRRQVGPSF